MTTAPRRKLVEVSVGRGNLSSGAGRHMSSLPSRV